MKKIKDVLLGCSLLLSTAIGPIACSLSKPYPAKQLYAIDVGSPSSAAESSPGSALRVLRVRVAEPFSNREFHYLVAPNQFQQDYYANFVADPGQLLTTELIEWLFATGTYAAVVDASSPVKTERSLQCVVSQMYGDMSNSASPKAVIVARFFLLDETNVDEKVLFTRDYQQSEPTNGTGADKLTQAWGLATKKMFEQLTADLGAVKSGESSQSIGSR